MSHEQQQAYFRDICARFAHRLENANKILEIGSQNINGSVRDFFPVAREYLGIDLGLAKDVDWTIPGELIELPNGWADVVISTECFEHCRNWDRVLINMIRVSKPGGLILVTCAGIGRATHGTPDSNVSDSPFTGSYYKNLGTDDLTSKISTGWYFSSHGFEVNSECHDLYFWGLRSTAGIQARDHYWEDAESRLARAQGQLGHAVARHTSILSELEGVKARVEQAKAEAEQAKAEAEQAKAEAEQAKAEAEQAKAEAEQARAEASEKTLKLKEFEESLIWSVMKPVRSSLGTWKRLLRGSK